MEVVGIEGVPVEIHEDSIPATSSEHWWNMAEKNWVWLLLHDWLVWYQMAYGMFGWDVS